MMVWAVQGAPSLQERIDRMIWKNRIVLVYAPGEESDYYKEQLRLLDSAPGELTERDIVVITCLKDRLSLKDQGYLIRQYQSKPEAFGVWLIGKDGSVKLQSERPVSQEKLFGLIDSMPMRRAEMKRRN
ncbi:DUF4174 domain-containing protein [Telluribacter sp. SYSU D00476]|uniref:DUF4174 domain-containing protein n=1 Tax=Telluribacter sp. SYSU D00476 TaxID=2811430 RepID=UPI001FF67F33|nr:DUF4174 domain-containing protein [Telluribacter sp. SYSU D00476]